MSELHWTGAALLLALAILGGRSPRPSPEALERGAVYLPSAQASDPTPGSSHGPSNR